MYDVSRLGKVLDAPGSDKLSSALSASTRLYQLHHPVSYPIGLPAGHRRRRRKVEQEHETTSVRVREWMKERAG